MRPDSIRTRMTIGFSLFIAALLLAMCAAFFIYTKHTERNSTDLLLKHTAEVLQVELDQGEDDFTNLPSYVRDENAELRVQSMVLMVLDGKGRLIAPTGTVPAWPQRGDAWRMVSSPRGNCTLILALPWTPLERRLRERVLVLLELSVLVVGATAIGTWILVGRTLSPIDTLARQAQALSTESLQVHLEASSPDAEIQRLVTTLNDLLARLSETAAMRGRFYAAASHELRTPLQALTGHLEVALSRQRNAADYQIALQEGHQQAERLTALVQGLLLLNQLETKTSRPPGVLLDLADICVSELTHLRPVTQERGLTIQLSLPDHCEVTMPWSHTTILIRNLLENAIKYATSSSAVCVHMGNADGDKDAPCCGNGHTPCRVRLTIVNDYAGGDLWDNDKYFEPFFRPDTSRNSQTGGNGLGLAICKAICDANGWQINLEAHEGRVHVAICFEPLPQAIS